MSKPEASLDVECYRNYALFRFENMATGRAVDYELYDGKELDVRAMRKVLRKYRIVTFNGNGYDLPITMLALSGASNEELKDAGDAIIQGGLRSWHFYRTYDLNEPDWIDHIDLFEVAPGVATGLKIYGGRLHCPTMQDLPIEPHELITPEQRPRMRKYCGNDHHVTKLLRNALKDQLDLRASMSAQYGMDLMSKSDAQIAEAVIRKEIQDIVKRKLHKPDIPAGTSFNYKVPEFIRFTTPEMQEVLRTVASTKFRLNAKLSVEMPKALDDLSIKIGNSVYRMGIGGLHSSESTVAHFSDDEYQLIDRDVASYYPWIILLLGLYPKHLGEHFLVVYRSIVERRLAAKKAASECFERGDDLGGKKWQVIADSLKICINGSFGKFGSCYSVLFAPDLLIQTTITGQLSLLMLIESLEQRGIPVVSANTDGVVIKCPRSKLDLLNTLVGCWEMDTGFDTEETRYKALYSRDVNNYIAVYEKPQKGKLAKTKGAYAPTGLMKNPQNEICVTAVVEHLTKGVPLSETITGCEDITKFITVRQVKGGAIQGHCQHNPNARVAEKRAVVESMGWRQVDKKIWMDAFDEVACTLDEAYEMSTPMTGATYLGKAVRWYYAEDERRDIRYKTTNTSGNHNRVPRTEGARPLMTLPDEFPTDVDYGWYIREAESILRDVGAPYEEPDL